MQELIQREAVSAASIKMSRRLEEWKYRLCGPTLVHLRYEFYLLCSLMLFAIGSMAGLYKESFGMQKEDFSFLLLLFFAAGRHLFFRLLCTWDPSTHASPGICGFISHLLQSHIGDGQSFDRPPALQQLHTPGGSTSTTSTASPSAADRLVQITGGGVITDAKMIISWTQVVPDSFVYAWQLPRQYIWFPLSRMLSRSSNSQPLNTAARRRSSEAVPLRTSGLARKLRALRMSGLQLWLSYGPSLQVVLLIAVFAHCTGQLYYASTGKSLLPVILGSEKAAQDIAHMSLKGPDHSPTKKGWYDRLLQPTACDLLTLMLEPGTILSVLIFSRIIPPIPDLVAGGGNVIKDLRAEARSAAATQAATSSSRIGLTGKILGPIRDFFAYSMAPSVSIVSETAGWSERHVTIASENRLFLALHVLCARVIENVILFGILPRTHYTCRATGHCPSGPPLWELSRTIHPGGYSEPKRPDGSSFFLFMESDLASALWTLLGVAFVSIMLLVGQSIILNRSYLSVAGYIAGEWELVEDPSKKVATAAHQPSSVAVATTQPATVWEPRRKYKKDDLVYYPDSNSASYRATLNSPEGRPYDGGVNEMLRMELGHPATSDALGKTAALQLVVVLAHAVILVSMLLFGYTRRTHGLTWAVLAHAVAANGVLSAVSPALGSGLRGKGQSTVMKELKQLSAEIGAGN